MQNIVYLILLECLNSFTFRHGKSGWNRTETSDLYEVKENNIYTRQQVNPTLCTGGSLTNDLFHVREG